MWRHTVTEEGRLLITKHSQFLEHCMSLISWNLSRTHLSHLMNRISADDLATQGTRVSAAMILIQFAWNIPDPVQNGLPAWGLEKTGLSVECQHMASIYHKHENQPSIHWHISDPKDLGSMVLLEAPGVPRGNWPNQCASGTKGILYGFRIMKISSLQNMSWTCLVPSGLLSSGDLLLSVQKNWLLTYFGSIQGHKGLNNIAPGYPYSKHF